MTQEGPKHVECKLCSHGVIPQHNILVGSVNKFLQFVHDDMQNCKIYRQISLSDLKQTDILSPLLYNLTAQCTSKNVEA
jgi:hypothetical protein